MDMFIPVRFKTSVHLAPKEMTADFEDRLFQKLRENLEGLCTRHGYIKPGSIEIARRSGGQFVKQHFNGHLRFDVVCRAEVCNPPQNAIVEAIVKNKNELGVHAESTLRMGDQDVPVLDIIIPKRAAGIQSEIDLTDVQTGDKIFVEVLGKRFQLNDRKISIIGRATKGRKAMQVVSSETDGDEEPEEENPFYDEEEVSEPETDSTEDEAESDSEEEEVKVHANDADDLDEQEEEDEKEEEEEYEEYDDNVGSDMDDIQEISDEEYD